jgi:hypothetical protein
MLLACIKLSEISGSHGVEYEDGCFLGCYAVQSGRILPTFQSCLHHQVDERR